MKFSIVIPTLNEEKYLSGILGSLAIQTHNDFEVIVVDSPKTTDKTKDVALNFKDKLNLTYLVSDIGGVAAQRNYGAKHSNHDYIIFFDADTLIEPLFINKIDYYWSKNKDVDVIDCWLKPISSKKRDKVMFWSFNKIRNSVKKIKPIVMGACIISKKEPFFKVKGFSSEIVYGEDSDLVIRMIKKGYKYVSLKDPIIYFSVRRLDIKGRAHFVKLNIGAGFYHFFKGAIKDYDLFKYEMDGKIR